MKTTNMKTVFSILLAFLTIITVFALFPIHTNAKDLDEIVNYDITVQVNSDATLTMYYHI